MLWRCGLFLLALEGTDIRSAGEGADGAYAGAEEGGGVVVGQDLERVAKERAHLDHGFKMAAEHPDIEESDIVSGEVEAAGPCEVNEGCGGRCKRAVPEIDELAAAFVS